MATMPTEIKVIAVNALLPEGVDPEALAKAIDDTIARLGREAEAKRLPNEPIEGSAIAFTWNGYNYVATRINLAWYVTQNGNLARSRFGALSWDALIRRFGVDTIKGAALLMRSGCSVDGNRVDAPGCTPFIQG